MIDLNLLIKIVIIILFILLVIVIYNLFFDKSVKENMINIDNIDNAVWTRNQCPYIMNETLKKVLEDNNLKHENNNINGEWQLYFPCTYDNIDEEINNINLSNKNDKRFFIINNADFLIGKDYLWSHILQFHGLEKAKKLIPETYLLYINQDLERIKRDFDRNKLYILKKNIQRQEGLRITNSLEEIMMAKNEDYVIVQELLQDPYLIDGRKINMRFYILVICKDSNMDVYVFNNGFMYYTKEPFRKNCKDFGPNITTGYVDRWVYDVNPLTHNDFKKYLDNQDRDLIEAEREIISENRKISEIVFGRIYLMIREIFESFIGKVCGGKLKDNVSFQLFGADVAINDQLYPKIMEINKGPDMSIKDERDGNVKYKCINDILQLVGVLPNNNNGFIKILEYEK